MAESLEANSSFPPPLARSRRFLRRNRTTVGLDVGGAALKMAEVAWDRETPRLVDFAAIQMLGGSPLQTDPSRVAGDLERLFASRGWEGSRVVAGLSGSVAFFRHLRLPNLPAADLREAARWEGQSQLPYPPSDVVVDYQPLGLDAEGKAEVLMAGAPRRAVEQVVDLANQAGITLVALEVDSLAIYRALEWNGLVAPGLSTWTVVCDLGHEDATLTAFKAGARHLVRSLPWSERLRQDWRSRKMRPSACCDARVSGRALRPRARWLT
ncbi:MAG: pilus assembly protein PilM [Firmicutes bacterium]|nr:pilus assembly protein PilM [Bacillota bacterium]